MLPACVMFIAARARPMRMGNHPVEFLPLLRRQHVLQARGRFGDVHHPGRMGGGEIGAAARDAGGIGRLVGGLADIAGRAFDGIRVGLPGFLLRWLDAKMFGRLVQPFLHPLHPFLAVARPVVFHPVGFVRRDRRRGIGRIRRHLHAEGQRDAGGKCGKRGSRTSRLALLHCFHLDLRVVDVRH